MMIFYVKKISQSRRNLVVQGWIHGKFHTICGDIFGIGISHLSHTIYIFRSQYFSRQVWQNAKFLISYFDDEDDISMFAKVVMQPRIYLSQLFISLNTHERKLLMSMIFCRRWILRYFLWWLFSYTIYYYFDYTKNN